MFNPVSTYRIQFHKDFTFNHFEKIIPYLETLGVNTIYASPVFESTPGSTHGYDGVNPLKINPEIGTIEQLRSISKTLREKKINWIQDIVPNHMAFHSNNEWLMDLLEKGAESAYKDYFDQTLSDDLFSGALMVPFLGSTLEEVIEKGEIKIEQKDDKLVFNYMGNTWPLNKESYPDQEKSLDNINKDKDLLLEIAGKQHYRLCNWQETEKQINYRRFFTVNGLICINIQIETVFNRVHQLISDLVREGVFQGLRVDHIDGLYNPSLYLNQLRKLAGDEVYIVVEKILEPAEEMPSWPIEGNTGYDFLSSVNNLLTNTQSKAAFTDFYNELTGNSASVTQQIRDKKAYILFEQMAGELDNLTKFFLQSDLIKEKEFKKVSPVEIKDAIAEFLIRCPVYRYYGNHLPLPDEDSDVIEKIFEEIIADKSQLKSAAHLIKKVWQGKAKDDKALKFYQRCMQLTGPLMAKGVEDTLMYTYNRFTGHNEVGDAPESFGVSVEEFHKTMIDRQEKWPLSMNGTATHDTKRGEDARARLNVLTDIPDLWLQIVKQWQDLNRTLIKDNAPDANDEYLVYQTLVASYPMPGQPDDDFEKRLDQYLEKALREAKVHSGWAQPNEAYENSVKQFAKKLLDQKGKFWKSFTGFNEKIAGFGAVNSLTQTLLKFTAPGMPDTYQGCELFDFSMVDPDNRRPVNYEQRNKFLNDVSGPVDVKALWQNKFSGEVKLWLTQTLLHERKKKPLVFAEGEYLPLTIEGKYAANVIAFARKYKYTCYIIAAPLGLAGICEDALELDWEDTKITLPVNAPDEFENLFTKQKSKIKGGIPLSAIFNELPVAILKLQFPDSKRGSGILMHITSLPSSFGIGDFGPQARAFADTLHASYQKYWQLLPLSPVDEKSQFSPYSAWSGMGGNILLISPEQLVNDGLLFDQDIEKYVEPSTEKVDFKTAGWLKDILFETAWLNYKNGNFDWMKIQFEDFCGAETYWLNDFALYITIKNHHDQSPWYTWPDPFKLRDQNTLLQFESDNIDAIEKAKWLQFIFNRQWQQLKKYCNQLDINLFGDLPFYVGYDSADVWAHPDNFALTKDRNIALVAGVPPDYFNANGQLWGMPVFNWDTLKEQGYEWWVQRIRKNLEYFNLLRLDHFRAFSEYWAVPAIEETAINGTWEKGPGTDLFNVLTEKFGELPFIAEDLGDINDAVYELRDTLNFPGMKVLQFAFGNTTAQSPHIPHNYTPNHIVYTGTHDNNTTLGWFRQDADEATVKQVEKYLSVKPKEKNITGAFIETIIASVAKMAIIPVQDLYDLDENARMNMPAGTDGNWLWRLKPDELKQFPVKHLRKLTKKYNRI